MNNHKIVENDSYINSLTTNTLQTRTDFSNKSLNIRIDGVSLKGGGNSVRVSSYVGPIVHRAFEIVEDPNGESCKLAYGQLFDVDTPDHEIEFYFLRKYEDLLKKETLKSSSGNITNYRDRVKYHYKRLIPYMHPRVAAGWNRWSEDILDLFVSEKIYHVVWGSGNCGKSIIMAVLLYIKWRVNPTKRMVIIAAKIVKDSEARVFGYIKEIHAVAPPDYVNGTLKIIDNDKGTKGIFSTIEDENTGKRVRHDRGCIVLLPIKTNLKAGDIGANLMGKHPEDKIILAFDECQEIIALILQMKIFANWLTNANLEVHAWGNPIPVNYNAKETWDLLFHLGASFLSITTLRKYEKRSDKTDRWRTFDTEVLRLTMLDSPKDDVEERSGMIVGPDGIKRNRLYFLAGQDSVHQIAQKVSPHSSAWYSQVLGFPYIDTEGDTMLSIISPHSVRESKRYPLIWKNEREVEWFMGIDPSLTGENDDCSILCGRVGMMMDGRIGIDVMNGEFHRVVRPVEGEEFADVTIEIMHALCRQLGIPLKNIGLEVHGTGEVFRYAMQHHIENGKWAADKARGQEYFIVSPTIMPTDRLLFKELGRMMPANEMCADIMTEYYMAVRCAVLTKQIFNIPDHIINQFYTRELQRHASKKFKVESKESMRKKGIKSPSLADSLVNLVEVMRRNGNFRYRFTGKAAYNEVYGKHYWEQNKRDVLEDNMGIVSRMLQIDLNLGRGRKTVESKNFWDVPAI